MSNTLGTLREYETVFVVNPELSDEVVNTDIADRLKAIVTRMGGDVLRDDRWGKRKLSFEMRKQGRGNYVLFHYVGGHGLVEELERTLRNMEHVVRYVTTMNGEVHDLEAKKAEVEKMVRERAADKARQEAEKKERDERAVESAQLA